MFTTPHNGIMHMKLNCGTADPKAVPKIIRVILYLPKLNKQFWTSKNHNYPDIY